MSCIAVPAAAILSSRRRATPSTSSSSSSSSSSRATHYTKLSRRATKAASSSCCGHDDDPIPISSGSSSRRLSLVGFGATTLAAALSSTQRAAVAEVLTPRGYEDPTVAPEGAGGFNLYQSDADSSIGCAYTVEWPSGWCALSDLSSARSVGVDASFKNPVDEASTLAVFVSNVPNGQRSVTDQGSLARGSVRRVHSFTFNPSSHTFMHLEGERHKFGGPRGGARDGVFASFFFPTGYSSV